MDVPFIIAGSPDWAKVSANIRRPEPDYTKPTAEEGLKNAYILSSLNEYEEIKHPWVAVYLQWVLGKEPPKSEDDRSYFDRELKEALTQLAEFKQRSEGDDTNA